MATSSEELFQSFIKEMRKCVERCDIHNALKNAHKALEIRHSDKLLRRIGKMEQYLEDTENENDGLVELGPGLFLDEHAARRLYPYQKEGIAWLWELFQQKKGGIMGDDMGLGKTVQVAAFLSAMLEQQHIKTVLIVLPVSLIPTWEKELDCWAPNVQVFAYTGTEKQRRSLLEKVQRRGGVLLTTYGIVLSSVEKLCADSFHYNRSFVWDYIILDEGHKIKNPTKSTKALHQISAKCRVILTGTPIQNNLRELWSLFDFAHKGMLLGTAKTFKMEFETPIVRSREKDATAGEVFYGNKIAELLRQRIEPYFLRRTKTEVFAVGDLVQGGDNSRRVLLPTKNDLVVWTFLTELQEKLYRDFLQLDSVKEVLMTTRSPLVELNLLKKICDHPRLLSANACAKLGLDSQGFEHDDGVEGVNFDHVSDSQLVMESGKLQFAIRLLKELTDTGHRCLVFSLSRTILDIFERILGGLGIRLMRIDGKIKSSHERQQRVDTFNEDRRYKVFLLTSQVGGVGLTITAADRVIIYDPSWNPATDSQAIDRAYRIGQDKPVIVYRLITCGTMEEKIYRRQVFKHSLHKQTSDGNANPYRYFSRQELYEMFTLGNLRHSDTQVQLEQMHSAHSVCSEELDQHIAKLYSFGIFGISHHDLLFSIDSEDAKVADADEKFMGERVFRAERMVSLDCEMSEKAYREQEDFGRQVSTTANDATSGPGSGRQAPWRQQGLSRLDGSVVVASPVVTQDKVTVEISSDEEPDKTKRTISVKEESTIGDVIEIPETDDDASVNFYVRNRAVDGLPHSVDETFRSNESDHGDIPSGTSSTRSSVTPGSTSPGNRDSSEEAMLNSALTELSINERDQAAFSPALFAEAEYETNAGGGKDTLGHLHSTLGTPRLNADQARKLRRSSMLKTELSRMEDESEEDTKEEEEDDDSSSSSTNEESTSVKSETDSGDEIRVVRNRRARIESDSD